MSIFSCCERKDETKYLHVCSCPTATFECESEEVDATLCGWEVSTYSTPSVPPDKYTVLTITSGGEKIDNSECSDFGEVPPIIDEPYTRLDIQRSGSTVYSALTNDAVPLCKVGTSGSGSISNTAVGTVEDHITKRYGAGGGNCPPSISDQYVTTLWGPGIGGTDIDYPSDRWSALCSTNPDATTATTCRTNVDGNGWDPSPGPGGDIESRYYIKTISAKDTDEDAVARGTPTTGTSCSSLWETRSTGFSFTKRTSKYTINCVSLVIGVEYEVTPSIRRRTAVIGSYGAWEDVTVAPITFTATSTTETIGDGGNSIALDHIQGYEYEITSVHIEKKA